jgi:hypothetical protein
MESHHVAASIYPLLPCVRPSQAASIFAALAQWNRTFLSLSLRLQLNVPPLLFSSPIVLCRRTQSDSECTQQKHRHHIVPPPSMSSATCTSQSQCQFLKRWLFRTFRDETEKRRKANTLFVTVDAPASDAYYPSCAPPHHSTMSCLHSTLSAAFHVPCATLRFLTLFTFIKSLRLGLFIYFYISDGAITVHLIELSISPLSLVPLPDAFALHLPSEPPVRPSAALAHHFPYITHLDSKAVRCHK